MSAVLSAPKPLLSVYAMRAWCAHDPLLDWLELHGPGEGFEPDDKRPGYDAETDMGLFLREKGKEFEAAVLRCLAQKHQVVRVAESGRDADDPRLAARTIQLMSEGVEIIHKPVLHDSAHGAYGMPSLLVRSDVLNRIADHPCIGAEEARAIHYRVVDIKFTSPKLTANGAIGGDLPRRARLLVYNRALGQMQGFEPPLAYILGRSFSFSTKGGERGDGCFDRLAPADMLDPTLAQLVDEAFAWARKVRDEGASWQVLPRPTRYEAHPNMSNTRDSPWHMAKKEVAEQLGEVTLLWQVWRPIAPRRTPQACSITAIRSAYPRFLAFPMAARRRSTAYSRQTEPKDSSSCARAR